jgi:thioredoxin 1
MSPKSPFVRTIIKTKRNEKGEYNMPTLNITQKNYNKEVVESELPVLLDFWAPWCGPCRMVAPVLEELSQDVAGKAKIGKVNVDEQSELARAFGIASIPTLVVMKNGKPVQKAVGARGKSELRALLGI